MSLEGVKVGDRVWVGIAGTSQPRIEVATIARVTPKRMFGSQGQQWHRSNGRSCNYRKSPDILEVATAEEVVAWEAEQAQKKAAAEAAEREREKAREEKRERLIRLSKELKNFWRVVSAERIEITFEYRKYRIEEVEHREE